MADVAAPVRAAYVGAGVDVEAGDRLVDLLRARGTIGGSDLLGSLGGFGAALPLPVGYREPVLVSSTDGVGTKLEIARELDRWDGVGRDLVAMCADDLVCHGARPWFFLDYVATGRLDPERIARVVASVAGGCAEAGCALVGGETAEHRGVMADDAIDLAGFCIGIVERDRLLDGSTAQAGDAVVGVASSGLHSNGFSLVRKLVAEAGLDLRTPHPALGHDRPLGDVLLEPTRIYAPALLDLREALDERGLRLSGIAHVTGGGLPGNLPRAVPKDLAIEVDLASWKPSPIFGLLQSLGGLSGPELRSIFNCGMGMALVVEPVAVGPSIQWLGEHGLEAWRIGSVVDAAGLGETRYREVGA